MSPDTISVQVPFPAGGEMGRLVRAHNWAATPLGAVETWPQSLRTAAGLVLASHFPMILLWGPELVQIYNDGYRAIMAAKHPAGLGQRTQDCWPEVWDYSAPIYQRVFGGETLSFKDRLYAIARRGYLEDAYFSLSYSPVPDEAGAVAGVLIMVFETTDQLRAEAERREALDVLGASEARYRAFVHATSNSLYRLSADGTQRLGESSGLRQQGQTAAPGRSWLESHVHPDDRERTFAAWSEVIRTKSVFEFEHRGWRQDGTIGWVLSRAVPVRNSAGEVVEWLVTATDISARKGAEAQLRDSEAQFRAIAETMPQIVWTARPDGEHDYHNQRWYAYTGLPRECIALQDWKAVIHPDDLASTEARWRRSLQTGDDYEVEYRFRSADGRYRWFIGRGLALRDREGRIARWFGTMTDIEDIVQAREILARGREEMETLIGERTAALRHALDALHAEVLDRERAEDALRHGQKMEAIGQLTGGIAHDFNNMLQGIASSLETIERRVGQGRGGEIGRYLETARHATKRAAGLTHRLLAFARRQALDPRPAAVGKLVEGMEELIRRTMGPGVAVELRLGDPLWTARCDPNQLENALLNLAINARDAMPDGGRLAISTEQVRVSAEEIAAEQDAAPGDFVAVAVSDTGIGMPPDVMEHAFEPFFTTKPTGQGTGLGLSQIYGFAQQSGGFVRLRSAPGHGTTVLLYLPRCRQAAAGEERQAARGAPEAAVSGETLLLVDDEATLREMAATGLRELGYRVLEAEDGGSALRLLDSGAHVDLLVTDVGLPGGLNGRQLAEVARGRRPGLGILFITGYAGAFNDQLAPGIEVLGKPFRLEAMAERIRAMLATAPFASSDL